MKSTTTTLPPMKVGKNQVLLPSGVVMSKDGTYHYWQCSVSGLATFAKPDYWVKIMAKYGSEANLVKTYVCRKAQGLLDAGKSQAEIVAMFANPKAVKKERIKKETARVTAKDAARAEKAETKRIKAERKAALKKVRKPRTPSLKSFAVGKVEVEMVNETGSLVKEVVPVYPWQGDPTYFGNGGTSLLSVAEATKDSCAYPNRFLDGDCKYCSAFSECSFAGKGTENKKAVKAIEKPLKSFND